MYNLIEIAKKCLLSPYNNSIIKKYNYVYRKNKTKNDIINLIEKINKQNTLTIDNKIVILAVQLSHILKKST